MTRPLLIYTAWKNKNGQYGMEHGRLYQGEHAEIMRLAFGIPATTEVLVQI